MAQTDLTSRCFLALAGAVLALALGALPASAAPKPPRAVGFAMPVPEASLLGGTISRILHTTPAIDAPKRFDLIGLRWPGRERPRVDLRTRKHDGHWTKWLRLPLTGDHAPDGEQAPPGTEPAWAGGADQFQLRSDRSVRGMRARFVNSTGTTTADGRARAAERRSLARMQSLIGTGGASAAANKPKIISRSEWGGDSVAPRDPPSYGEVKLAFVHHTVGTNDYQPEDSASIVLAIAKFHRDGNGWSDIGYNFLVDKYGQVFEGRAGGIEKAVVGAQAQGFNSVSTSVSNLGTFSTVPQTTAGINAVASLLAWKLGLHGVPVTGTVSAGGKTFERISGHRDANSTECPGDSLYGQLAQIRSLAASGGGGGGAPAPTGSLTLATATSKFIAGKPIRISGSLRLADGSTPSGALVEIQIQRGDGYRTTTKVRTGAGGSWSARLRRSSNARVRASNRDTTTRKHLFSSPSKIVVGPALTASVSPRRAKVGSRVVASGTVKPAKSRVDAQVERRGRDGSFSRVTSVRGRARRGKFSVPIRLAHSGIYRITMRTKADLRNGSGEARQLTVRAGGKR